MKNDKFEDVIKKYDLDQNLVDHMVRVSRYTEILADLMCIEKCKIKYMKKGAILHDIGKKKLDYNILNKPSELTPREFEHIKKHPKFGLEILRKIDRNEVVENMILLHHERWDGKGYPFGLIGKQIPIEARVLSVIDCYDALTAERVYKESITHEKTLEIIKAESGKRFDPDIVAIFEIFEMRFKDMLKKEEIKKFAD